MPRTTPGQQPIPFTVSPWGAAWAATVERQAWAWLTMPRVSKRSAGGSIARHPSNSARRRAARPRRLVLEAVPSTKPKISSFSSQKMSRGSVQDSFGMETLAHLHEDAPHPAEEAGPLEAQVLPVPHPGPGLPQYPAEEQALQRPAGQKGSHPLFRRSPDGRFIERLTRPSAADPAGEFADGTQQRQGIVMERGAFQFQLIQTAVAELLQIGRVERSQLVHEPR